MQAALHVPVQTSALSLPMPRWVIGLAVRLDLPCYAQLLSSVQSQANRQPPTAKGVLQNLGSERKDDDTNAMNVTSEGAHTASSSRVAVASYTLEGPPSSSASRLVLLHQTP
jgi:hypothetical protein